jgi:serine/threonine protein kinase
VKRLDLNVAQSEEHFLREVAALAGLHHPHVVELVGYCSEGPTRILVHEFVPNRTLQDHLHGDRETGEGLCQANLFDG